MQYWNHLPYFWMFYHLEWFVYLLFLLEQKFHYFQYMRWHCCCCSTTCNITGKKLISSSLLIAIQSFQFDLKISLRTNWTSIWVFHCFDINSSGFGDFEMFCRKEFCTKLHFYTKLKMHLPGWYLICDHLKTS